MNKCKVAVILYIHEHFYVYTQHARYLLFSLWNSNIFHNYIHCHHDMVWSVNHSTKHKACHSENFISLQWRHNERDGVSNHQPYHCLLNHLFRRGSKKTSKLRVTGLCAGNSLVTGEFPAQRPVTRKMFPFDDVIMFWALLLKFVTLKNQ